PPPHSTPFPYTTRFRSVTQRPEVRVRLGLDADLRGLPEHARDPRVRVLRVEDGIVRALLLRELEIELEMTVGLAGQEEEARGVRSEEHTSELQSPDHLV